jgi:antitoxin component HigA of HigAB toxin-antitoxin module
MEPKASHQPTLQAVPPQPTLAELKRACREAIEAEQKLQEALLNVQRFLVEYGKHRSLASMAKFVGSTRSYVCGLLGYRRPISLEMVKRIYDATPPTNR